MGSAWLTLEEDHDEGAVGAVGVALSGSGWLWSSYLCYLDRRGNVGN